MIDLLKKELESLEVKPVDELKLKSIYDKFIGLTKNGSNQIECLQAAIEAKKMRDSHPFLNKDWSKRRNNEY